MQSSPTTLARLFAGSLLLGGFTAGALAQTAPAATAAPAESAIELSPFEVSSTNDEGSYVASESMTGSRVAVKIVDLPYTVNVLTNEFFEDFGLFELADNITHVGSFTGLDIGGGFVLRGFSSSSQLRDGFYRLGRYGSSNVDRMEIIKGSNAAIYGRTSPGGMVNMISKQPKSRASDNLTVNIGDYDTQRYTLESTGPLFPSRLGKTNYILTLSHYEKGFDIPFSLNRNLEAYLAVKHTFADNSSLFLSAEYFFQRRRSPNSAAPLIIDQKGTATNTDDEAVGYAKALTEYNAFGLNSELNRGNVGLNAVYDKKLSQVWSFRAAGNYYRARRWDYNQNTGFGTININTTNGIIQTQRGATPNKGLIFEDGGGVQADFLATYRTFDRKVENRTLLTIDFNDYYRWDPTWNYAGATNPDIVAWNAVRTIRLNPDFTPVGEIQYFPKRFEFNGQEQVNRLTKRRTTVLGGLVRHQSAFMEGRLLTYAGARFDAVRFRHRDFRTTINGIAPGDIIPRSVTELKPNLGFNYKLTPEMRFFVNYSESYFVNQTDNPDVIAENDYKSEIADGYDYGFKGSYFNDRLNFTVSGYYATRSNVRVSEQIEEPEGSGNYVIVNRRDGDQLVRGYEADINWRISDEWVAGGSYGNVNSIYTDFGSANPLAVGRKVNGVSPQNGSLYVKYNARSGRLRGFSANLGVTYVDETPTEAPNAGDTYTTVNGQRVLQRTTRQWALTVPSYTIWSVGLRYTYRGNPRLEQTFALNLNNMFDVDYLKANRQAGDRRAIYFSYSIARQRSGN